MDFTQAYNLVANTAQYNNAWSAEQAARQMDFQERMSNTAIQRQVADMKAAGINPVLAAKYGGASTPTGAAASADSSLTGAVLQLASQAMEANTMSAAALFSGTRKQKSLTDDFGVELDNTPDFRTEEGVIEFTNELKFDNANTPQKKAWNTAVDLAVGAEKGLLPWIDKKMDQLAGWMMKTSRKHNTAMEARKEQAKDSVAAKVINALTKE